MFCNAGLPDLLGMFDERAQESVVIEGVAKMCETAQDARI
jgi:hypothetical protein